MRRFCGALPAKFIKNIGVRDMHSIEELSFATCITDGADADCSREYDILQLLALGEYCGTNGSILPQTRMSYLDLITFGVSESIAFRLLTSLPLLEVIVLTIQPVHKSGGIVISPSRRTELLNLKTLSVKIYPAFWGGYNIMDIVRIPNMLDLCIDGLDFSRDERNWLVLHGLLDASRAPLARLSLSCRFGQVFKQDGPPHSCYIVFRVPL